MLASPGLDAEQRAAVTSPPGYTLVVAGAGSGKTRTLTSRVIYLLEQGVSPAGIMAITFTRKAAGEMRERIARSLDTQGGAATFSALRIGTFHAQMASAMRRETDMLAAVGRTRSFSIWDEDDRDRALKILLRSLPDANVSPHQVAKVISAWKNEGRTEETLPADLHTEPAKVAAGLWKAYEGSLRASDAFDFDDLLLTPAQSLRANASLRERWSRRIEHLLVDEFQDTNTVQFDLVESLASVHGNLFVVGDDAQSIYRFRGARVELFRTFGARHPGSHTYMLTTNYRSTQRICDVGNAVLLGSDATPKELRANRGRDGDWRGQGAQLVTVPDEQEEARYVTAEVRSLLRAGLPPAGIAVLMRQNSQSRLFEIELSRNKIPYRLLGGTRFYARKEVRDVLAWLRLIVNPADAAAAVRALATPPRGVGEKIIEAVRARLDVVDEPWLVAALHVARTSTAGTAKGRASLNLFAELCAGWAVEAERVPVEVLVRQVARTSGMLDYYGDGSDENARRIENIGELVNAATGFAAGELPAFLERAALDANVDEPDGGGVTLATIHAAKGLEWATVFVVGCEEGLIPHINAIGEAERQEERRLFYVAVTRAKRHLILLHAKRRLVFGRATAEPPSRFLGGPVRPLLERAKPY